MYIYIWINNRLKDTWWLFNVFHALVPSCQTCQHCFTSGTNGESGEVKAEKLGICY